MEDQFAGRGGRVDSLLEGAELAVPIAESLDLFDQVFEGAPQPIELPDDPAVASGLTYKIAMKESSHVVVVPARLFSPALDAGVRL